MHACYHACMKTLQYTVRGIPHSVDAYLRRRARLSGKSLNQVIIDELSDKVDKSQSDLAMQLDWFINSGLDSETEDALDKEDKNQKALIRQKGY